MLLDQNEIEKFARYCEVEAESLGGIIEQLKKLSIPEGVIKSRQAIQKAFVIVAMELRAVESEVVDQEGQK